MAYSVEILDNTLAFKALAKNLVPIDNAGNVLEFNNKLSDWGKCRFRLGTKDPLFTSEGNILRPYKYHVRIKRAQATVWQGVIVNKPHRTSRFIEVEAFNYLYLLSRVLIRHNAADGTGAENYRTIKAGTMAAAISTILTEAKTDMGLPITSLTVGTIDNPNYPAAYVDDKGTALTGAWTFTDNFQLKFSFQDVLYMLNAFGIYGNFDFELTNDLIFNFKQFIGNRQPQLVFEYGEFGSVEDYDLPEDGAGMATVLIGIAADNQDHVLRVDKESVNVTEYGKLFGVAPYADAKNKNVLSTRLQEELRMVDHPDAEAHFTMNERVYPLGQYGVGDILTYKVVDGPTSFNQQRRLIELKVQVHNTGKETIRHITNVPRDGQ